MVYFGKYFQKLLIGNKEIWECERVGIDLFEIVINFIKIVVIFLLMIQMVPLLVWVERRGSAFIQNRFGPNRIGPLGLVQNLADLVKFLCKEDFLGSKTRKNFFYIAPVLSIIPAALAFGGYSPFFSRYSRSF